MPFGAFLFLNVYGYDSMFSTVEAAFIFPADSLRAMRGHWIWGRAGLRRGDKPCQAGRCAAAVRWESGRDVSGYVGWAGAAGGDRKGNRRVLMTRVGGDRLTQLEDTFW